MRAEEIDADRLLPNLPSLRVFSLEQTLANDGKCKSNQSLAKFDLGFFSEETEVTGLKAHKAENVIMNLLCERPHVVVADDEPAVRTYLCAVLKQSGLEPIEAPNGEIALELLERHRIDLLLLDIGLPGKNGIEVLIEAKKLDRKLPIVLITGTGSITAAIEAIKRGAENYLTKPFQAQELLDAVVGPMRKRLAWRAGEEAIALTSVAEKSFAGLTVFCPFCGGSVQATRFRGVEPLLFLVGMAPYRCWDCEKRFWHSPIKRCFERSQNKIVQCLTTRPWGKRKERIDICVPVKSENWTTALATPGKSEKRDIALSSAGKREKWIAPRDEIGTMPDHRPGKR